MLFVHHWPSSLKPRPVPGHPAGLDVDLVGFAGFEHFRPERGGGKPMIFSPLSSFVEYFRIDLSYGPNFFTVVNYKVKLTF